ncbi:MAG: cation transporter [Candidatus Aminicenantes bacterium]|nr:MAG: cation transporter [Candidatus Aminicenantes bacterium]
MKQVNGDLLRERERKIRSIILWGILANIFLIAIKVFSGVLIKSSALIADGFHSLSDLATDFVVLAGARLSSRPPDEAHPYGHKRFETLATQIVGLVLLAVGFGFIWKASTAIFRGEENFPGAIMLVVAGVSVIVKEVLFFLTRKISSDTHSTALYANAWHHRSDSLSSGAVLIGGVASLFGWGYADQVATIVVGLMIIGVAGKILYEGLIEITEHAADKKSIEKINKILTEEPKVLDWHALRTRKVGGELFIDLHLLVNPEISVRESHVICEKVEQRIEQELKKPINVLIHIEPCDAI